MEAGVLVGYEGQPIFWHLPEGRTPAFLPDSRTLWDVIWENRTSLYGFAHSHPGIGYPTPSREDITTFAGVEQGLGRRLVWWITSEDMIVTVLWVGPGRYDYCSFTSPRAEVREIDFYPWLSRLRELSENIREHFQKQSSVEL